MDPSTLDEAARQRALDNYRILDSLPENAYDDVVRLACMLCEVPIALVSLIDRDRQWFKAEIGMGLQEAPRSVAFCDHAIRTPELMEIGDAVLDTRFVDNPLVTGAPGIRFYAGMPLVTPGGAAVGTVCVIDREPRELSPQQREALGALARLTMNLLEGRERERALARAALLAARELADPRPAVPGAVDSDAGAAGSADTGGQAAEPVPHTVVIVEMQEFAGSVQRLGERAVEKALQRVDAALESALVDRPGDVVNRVTGSPEFIAVLRCALDEALQQRLHDCLRSLEADTGLRLLAGAAQAMPAGEAIERVFQRADQALSLDKSARARATAA